MDIHSSYGGVVESAPWYLLQALQSLRAADGRILVEGLYEEVQEPNEREMALLETYGQRNPEEVSRIYGLELPLLQEERMAFLKRFFSSQRLISKESSLVIKVRVWRLFYLQKPVPS